LTLFSVLWFVVALFPVSEVALAVIKHSNASSTQAQDRGSMRVLWIAIVIGVGCAIAAQWVPSARLHVTSRIVSPLALVLIVAGLIVRWVAILTLGRLFTVDVAIQPDHQLIQTGLYRLVRHPSYAGLLIAFLGLGLFFANWLSLVLLLVPITLAVMNRVVKEERVLLQALGAPYADYCARTKRLIPGVL
jgi:protein-S-isoprenylcysteine O-methyltransferase Ste14